MFVDIMAERTASNGHISKTGKLTEWARRDGILITANG